MSKPAVPSKEGHSDPIRRWPTPRSKNWTLNLLKEAHSNENVMAVIAVGSAVRPSVTSVDLDLIVICRKVSELTLKPPLEIDLRTYQAGQVDMQVAKGNDMLGWAIKFGRVLFQREGYWDSIVELWRDRLPLPEKNIADERAAEALRRLKKVLEMDDLYAAHEQALSYATHLARAELLKRKTYPASRPELPGQLRDIGSHQIADWLEQLISPTADHLKQIKELLEFGRQTNSCIVWPPSAARKNSEQ